MCVYITEKMGKNLLKIYLWQLTVMVGIGGGSISLIVF